MLNASGAGHPVGPPASAADAWRSLDRDVRRDVRRLARHLRIHPDSGVAAVAARYAREELGRNSRRQLQVPVVPVLLLFASVVAVIVLLPIIGGRASSTAASALVPLVGAAGAAVAITLETLLLIRMRRRFRVRMLLRIEAANRFALPSPAASVLPAVPEDSGPSDRQAAEIRCVAARIVRLAAPSALAAVGVAVTCVIVATHLTGPAAVALLSVLGVFALLLAVQVVVSVRKLARWVLPGRPIITLDAGGVHFAAIPYTLPWAELSEIRVFPIRFSSRGAGRPGASGTGQAILAFVPARPEQLLASMPLNRLQRFIGQRSLRIYGSPLSLTDRMLDQTTEQIAAAAARFTPVTVRRYEIPDA